MKCRGLSGISRGLDLRLNRSWLAAFTTPDRAQLASHRSIRDIGLDARYGLTAGLNMDVTINTDFAQVEVDEQQVNLTRFGLFYPEKRDFFLENSNFFTMGTGSAFTSTQVQTDLFFSRRIGLSDSGTPIPIQGGVRVAGSRAAITSACSTSRPTISSARPGENFFVGRYNRDILKRSRVGAHLYQQGLRRRRPLQPHDGPRCQPRAERQPAGPELHRQDRDARQGRQRHGDVRPHRVSRSEAGTCT